MHFPPKKVWDSRVQALGERAFRIDMRGGRCLPRAFHCDLMSVGSGVVLRILLDGIGDRVVDRRYSADPRPARWS